MSKNRTGSSPRRRFTVHERRLREIGGSRRPPTVVAHGESAVSCFESLAFPSLPHREGQLFTWVDPRPDLAAARYRWPLRCAHPPFRLPLLWTHGPESRSLALWFVNNWRKLRLVVGWLFVDRTLGEIVCSQKAMVWVFWGLWGLLIITHRLGGLRKLWISAWLLADLIDYILLIFANCYWLYVSACIIYNQERMTITWFQTALLLP